MVLDKVATAAAPGIVGVVRRVERSRVCDQRAASSNLRISSIRCDTYLRPLRPAALSLRLWPILVGMWRYLNAVEVAELADMLGASRFAPASSTTSCMPRPKVAAGP